jgi:hypothetical protein
MSSHTRWLESNGGEPITAARSLYTRKEVDALLSSIVPVYTGPETIHPPIAMTQDVESTIYGDFKVFSSSVSYTGTGNPEKAFNMFSSGTDAWGTYSALYETDTSGGDGGRYLGDKQHHSGSLVGEWVGIEFPYRIYIDKFVITCRQAWDAPRKFQIFGTNNDDAGTWNLLTAMDGVTWASNGSTKTFFAQVNTEIPYKRFVLVINENNARNVAAVAELRLHTPS